jgi:mRNA interferase HigB
MRVIALSRLRTFWEDYPDAESPLRRWYKVTSNAEWESFPDVRNTFGSADFWKSSDSEKSYVIFNIGGNNYRLVASVWYEGKRVYVKEVMTHSEYDKENWKENL